MDNLAEIQNAIRRLTRGQLAEFRAWFAEHDADAWDRDIEEDALAGRLDHLADEAVREIQKPIRCEE